VATSRVAAERIATRDGENATSYLDKVTLRTFDSKAPEKTNRENEIRENQMNSEKVGIPRPGQCTKREILSRIKQKLGGGYARTEGRLGYGSMKATRLGKWDAMRSKAG
jgi:hypothetical protein